MHKQLYIIIEDCKILYIWTTKRVPAYQCHIFRLYHAASAAWTYAACALSPQLPRAASTHPNMYANLPPQSHIFLSSSLNHFILLSLLSALHLFISLSLSINPANISRRCWVHNPSLYFGSHIIAFHSPVLQQRFRTPHHTNGWFAWSRSCSNRVVYCVPRLSHDNLSRSIQQLLPRWGEACFVFVCASSIVYVFGVMMIIPLARLWVWVLLLMLYTMLCMLFSVFVYFWRWRQRRCVTREIHICDMSKSTTHARICWRVCVLYAVYLYMNVCLFALRDNDDDYDDITV